MLPVQVTTGLEFATFGDFLKYLRRRAQLTQTELSIACGYSAQHISHLENNSRLPDQATLLALFVPALELQDEPELVERLLSLTAKARAENIQVATEKASVSLRPMINFQPASTQLVGRSLELAQIADLLQDTNCRLLTLVGPGGIGKTRLAMQAAREHIGKFSEGVCFVPLVGVRSPNLLISSIAEGLGSPLQNLVNTNMGGALPTTVKDHVLNYLHEKHMLLILDNFEHLVSAADFLSEVLQNAPDLKILVTSRELLALQEEWVFQVSGLDVPNNQPNRPLENYSAVHLFADRARHSQVDFSLAKHADAVIKICQLVEGMPLAIELAASLIGVLTMDEIAQGIAHDLDLLTTPLRNFPERHRSLRAVFEHSWKLLTETERAALAAISVFRDGFQRNAAEFVAQMPFRILLSLVNKSLVRLHSSGRYDLHELLREFAEEKLNAVPENCDIAHDRHLTYFRRLIEEAEPLLFTATQAETLRVSERERGNIRAALTWAHAKANGAEQELRLVAAMREFWWFYNQMEEGYHWLSSALERLADVSPSLQIRVLYAHSLLCYGSGHNDEGLHSGETALSICHKSGERTGFPWASIGTGICTPDPRQGIALLSEGLIVAREIGDQPATVHLGLCLGVRTFDLALKSQPTDAPLATEALSHLENVISLARKLGSRWDEAKAHDHQSRIWLELGDYVRAYAANDANLELVHELGEDKMQVAGCIMVKGNIARSQGDYALAQSCYEHAIKMFREHPYSASIQTYGLANLGYAALGLGNYAQARSCFEHKLRWDWKNSAQFVAISFGLATFASLSCELGEPERAAKLAGAVDVYLSQQNVRLQGADRIDYERRIASVIRDLGEPAFSAWFVEGRHMSLEEAVMFALEELPGSR